MKLRMVVEALVEVPSCLVVVISCLAPQMRMMLRTVAVHDEEEVTWACVLEVPEFLLVLKRTMEVELLAVGALVVVVEVEMGLIQLDMAVPLQ